LHVPPAHVSVVNGSHEVHVAPPVPHVVVEGTLQVLPVQQPVVHVCAHPEQTPLVQVCPPAQGAHCAPPMPHAPGLGVVHTPLAQHPFGHEAALQTH
jgi:hypothetical protein